ncbi:NlpC/P60 family protein [Psychrosphaera aquimarina]|uniref:NlpC/P60 family protein n=1 Tax=Psychrosphaera aquimarina TaxID=2044854 RepID=A0ABU3R1R3_9GAMM|nr:NlpC/P60 family protein [Psychrosphaera aquimarina]MDU0113228.1 NlpC/P60 family protein [Psychrosphaera aquimarina]
MKRQKNKNKKTTKITLTSIVKYSAFTMIVLALASCSPDSVQEETNRPADEVKVQFDQQTQDTLSTMQSKIIDNATMWNEKAYRVGKAEQCMNWTREVLVAACGGHFNTLETDQPWDGHLLGEGDKLLPEHADSLASETLGKKILEIDQLQKGDLVFLKNTYGNWAEGVITHIGIAMGNGKYIHRMTSNKGIVKIQSIDSTEFDAGLRLNQELCQ